MNYSYPREGVSSDDNHGVDQHHLIATYHYILSRMGINIDDYATTFKSGTYAFGTFGNGIRTLSQSILDNIRMGDDPDLKFLKTFLPDKSAGMDVKSMNYDKGSSEHRAFFKAP